MRYSRENRLLVVAASHEQFVRFCRNGRLKTETAQYIVDVVDLFGRRDVDYVVLTGAHEREDFTTIMDLLRARGGTEVML